MFSGLPCPLVYSAWMQGSGVPNPFASVPVHGAIDYDELKWESFSRVTETPAEFTFYSGKNLAKVISKSQFSSRQEIRAFRRVVHRSIADSALLND